MNQRMRHGALVGFALLLCWLVPTEEVLADDGRPAALTLREGPAGTFAVRWQTPVRGRATLRISPQLPEEAVQIEDSYDRTLRGDALVETWRFTLEGGLEGRDLGVIGGALLSRGVVVIVRATLASGTVHRAMLSSRRPSFTVPETATEATPRRSQVVASAAAEGWRHGLTWIHLVFALLLVVAGGSAALGWPLGAFFVADVLGRFVPLSRGEADLGLALVGLVAVLLAREALQARSRRVLALATLAGLCHGLTTAPVGDVAETIAEALGVDAAHGVVGVLVLLGTGMLSRPWLRRRLAWVGGVVACSLAIVAALGPPAGAATVTSAPLSPMALLEGDAATPTVGQSGAPRRTVKGIEVYLDIGVFQTRIEILARLPALGRWLDVPHPAGTLGVDEQPALLARLATAARSHLKLTVDGAAVEAGDLRSAFTTQDDAGVYLREEPGPESAANAVLGLVLKHPTARIPKSIRLEAADLPEGVPLRARILDPEVTREVPLSPDTPLVAWRNMLREDPLPPVTSLAVERRPMSLPLLGVLMCLAVGFGAWRARDLGAGPRLLLTRLAVFLLALLASTGTLETASLGDGVPEPSPSQQRTITATLLDNIYRAFNERGEDEVYDRLALSLTGDQLEHAYVENRRILDAQRFGGARAHVDVVDLRRFKALEAGEDGSFRAAVSWTVAGSVTHFGHRHLRRNRYEAVCLIGPEQGTWKIRDFDHHSTERED